MIGAFARDVIARQLAKFSVNERHQLLWRGAVAIALVF